MYLSDTHIGPPTQEGPKDQRNLVLSLGQPWFWDSNPERTRISNPYPFNSLWYQIMYLSGKKKEENKENKDKVKKSILAIKCKKIDR